MSDTRTPNWTYGQPRSTPLPVAPTPTSSHDYQPRHPEVAALAARTFRDHTAAGRAVGALKGYVGLPGGWIYTATGRVVGHGWASVVAQSIHYDRPAKGYRLGARELAKLDALQDRRQAQEQAG